MFTAGYCLSGIDRILLFMVLFRNLSDTYIQISIYCRIRSSWSFFSEHLVPTVDRHSTLALATQWSTHRVAKVGAEVKVQGPSCVVYDPVT